MSHTRLRERLGDYLEGDLDVPARSEIDEHLRGCAECRDELRGLRATVALLRGLPDPEPPAGLARSVLSKIAAEEGDRHRASGLPAGRLVAALAAALAAVALVASWRSSPTPIPPPVGPEGITIAAAPGSVEDPATARPGRPARSLPPAARALRPPLEMPSGVAPWAGFAELRSPSDSAGEREFDRQLELLLGDPEAFLAGVGPHARGDRFARLAQHAARRGRAAAVASQLIAEPHPAAADLVPRFLAASFAADAGGAGR